MNTDEAAIEMIRGRRAVYPGLADDLCCVWYPVERGYRFALADRQSGTYLSILSTLPDSDNWELLPEEPEPEWEDVPVGISRSGDSREKSITAVWQAGRKNITTWLNHPDCLGAIFELPDGTQLGPLPQAALIWHKSEHYVALFPRPDKQEDYETIRPKVLRFKKRKEQVK